MIKLKRLLLVIALLVLSHSAFAAAGDIVAITQWRVTFNSVNYTMDGYCPAWIQTVYGTAGVCVSTVVASTTANQYSQTWTISYKASSSSTTVGTKSVGALGYCDPAYYVGPAAYKSGDSTYYCKVVTDPPGVCTAGTVEDVWSSVAGVTQATYQAVVVSPPVSDGKCRVILDSMKTCVLITSTGVKWCQFSVHQAGDALSSDANWTDSTTAPAGASTAVVSPAFVSSTCPKGTVQAGADGSGTPICVGQGTSPSTAATSSSTTSPTTTTSNSDGSTVATSTTSVTNTDGSVTKTTTTTTTAADGTKTVSTASTTGNTPSGSAGVPSSSADQSNAFCKANPTLAVCQNSAVSGACTAGVSTVACTGDAIQCATLQQAAAMRCKEVQDTADLKASTQYTLGAAVAAGSDPQASSLPTVANGSTVTMPSSLDGSGWLGAGVAFADVQFSVQGHAITLPLSKWTGYLVGLRYALMTVALLVSFRMLSGVILRD